MLQFLILVIFPAALILAAVNDIATMTISNWISLVLVVCFGGLAIAAGLPWVQIGWHFAAGGLVLVICFALFAFNVLGGGDAKLLSAAALWVGWNDLFSLLFMTALLGGPLCVLLMMYRALPMPVWAYDFKWLYRLHQPKTGVPYGVAICGAGLIVYAETPLMKTLGA